MEWTQDKIETMVLGPWITKKDCQEPSRRILLDFAKAYRNVGRTKKWQEHSEHATGQKKKKTL